MAESRLNLGLVIPESGPSGIFGPSCAASAQLAVEELNAAGGVLGRQVCATTIDGGLDPAVVGARVRRAVDAGEVDALVGWHTSAVRRALVREVGGRVPYFYTAVYEGGETAPGVFMTGETPNGQLIPALQWMAAEQGIRSWMVIGSDYVWPRHTAQAVGLRFAIAKDATCPVSFAAARFLPLGAEDFAAVLDELERLGVDGVLLLLLGNDAVEFNRQFAARGLHDRCVRLSPLMDENMLLASGEDAAQRFFSVSGFFESIGTAHSLDFESRYLRRFGRSSPPLTSPGESCYEGMGLLAQLVRHASSIDIADITYRTQVPFRYDSPRGEVAFDGRHLNQDVYLARADGLEFDVLAQVGSA